MNEFKIAVKFEGPGAQVTFTEIEKEKSDDGVTTSDSKKYGKDFKTRGAAAEAIDLSFRRYLKTLGEPPSAELDLEPEKAPKKRSRGKLAAVKSVDENGDEE
jgi:hypothetical protein